MHRKKILLELNSIIDLLHDLGATEELISLIQQSEGIEGLYRLVNLLERYFSCDDIITLSKYGIDTLEYEIQNITNRGVAENIAKMLNTSEGYVDLYRAVGADEYTDIINTKKFNIKPDGSGYEGKQFGFNMNEILKLSDQFDDSVAIFRARVSKKTFTELDFREVDIHVLKSGNATVKLGNMLDNFNGDLIELEHVY